MSIAFDNYHHFGMENYDGGNEKWDFDHDGKLDLFEENSRRAFDEVMYETQFTYQNESEIDEDEEFSHDDFEDEDFEQDDFGDEDFDHDEFEDEEFDCDDFGEDW